MELLIINLCFIGLVKCLLREKLYENRINFKQLFRRKLANRTAFSMYKTGLQDIKNFKKFDFYVMMLSNWGDLKRF